MASCKRWILSAIVLSLSCDNGSERAPDSWAADSRGKDIGSMEAVSHERTASRDGSPPDPGPISDGITDAAGVDSILDCALDSSTGEAMTDAVPDVKNSDVMPASIYLPFQGTLSFSPSITCNSADVNTDCSGSYTVYISYQPADPTKKLPNPSFIAANGSSGGKNGAPYKIYAPVKPLTPVYVSAYLDDNKSITHDTGDPTYVSSTPILVKPGDTFVSHDIIFSYRFP